MPDNSFRRVLIDSFREAAWAPIGVFALHVLAAYAGAYARSEWLDQPMHFAGGAAIALLFASLVRHSQGAGFVGALHPAAHFVAVIGLTATAAVLWEFAEFVSDRFAGTRAQAGLEDTLLDLLLGLVGGAVLLVSRARRAVSGPEGERRARGD